jgi:hypothetical protein
MVYSLMAHKAFIHTVALAPLENTELLASRIVEETLKIASCLYMKLCTVLGVAPSMFHLLR